MRIDVDRLLFTSSLLNYFLNIGSDFSNIVNSIDMFALETLAGCIYGENTKHITHKKYVFYPTNYIALYIVILNSHSYN